MEVVLALSLGPDYVDGKLVLMIMLLYPLHQSMGQIGATMMYSTGQVKPQAALGMMFMLLDLKRVKAFLLLEGIIYIIN